MCYSISLNIGEVIKVKIRKFLARVDEVISTKTIFHNSLLNTRQSYPTNILKDNSMITMIAM